MSPDDQPEPPATREQRVRDASRRRRSQARDDLRARILAAAADLFVAHGYEGLSMRQLAERIGYTPTTIYLYFANKDALLFTLLDEGYSLLGQSLAEIAAAEADPLHRLEALGREYISFGREYPAHYQLMFMQRADFLQAKLAARNDSVDALQVLQAAVGQALAAGVLRPADPFAITLSLWASVHGMVSLLIVAPLLEPDHVQAAIDTLLSSLLAGIARKP